MVLGTLLLDRPMPSYGQPLDYAPCLDCKLCVAACPVGAIGPDGHFSLSTCQTHKYRDRLGGFADWVENMVRSKSVKEYRSRVRDSETVSMWQSLFSGVCNKSSYCLAVCPAGEDMIGEYLEDRKGYGKRVLKPLQDNDEPVYVLPGSDGLEYVRQHFPHKKVRLVGNCMRPASAEGFIRGLPLVFNRGKAKGLSATYHFTFKGEKEFKYTVRIKDQALESMKGHQGEADLKLIADEKTWLKFLAKEQGLLHAVLSGKLKIKGPPGLMKRFAACFPG